MTIAISFWKNVLTKKLGLWTPSSLIEIGRFVWQESKGSWVEPFFFNCLKVSRSYSNMRKTFEWSARSFDLEFGESPWLESNPFQNEELIAIQNASSLTLVWLNWNWSVSLVFSIGNFFGELSSDFRLLLLLIRLRLLPNCFGHSIVPEWTKFPPSLDVALPGEIWMRPSNAAKLDRPPL